VELVGLVGLVGLVEFGIGRIWNWWNLELYIGYYSGIIMALYSGFYMAQYHRGVLYRESRIEKG
jgi:hypothetical protein